MSDATPPPPPENPYGAGSRGTPPPPPSQPPAGTGAPGGYGGPGGYGASAPPPPPPAGPGGSGRPYSAPDAFSYGWAKFKAKPSELVIPVLVVAVVVIVLYVVLQVLLSATLLSTHACDQTILGTTVRTQCGPGLLVTLLGSALASLVVSLVVQMLGAGLIKNALNIVDGKPVSLAEIGTWATKPEVITAAAIVAVGTFIGTLLCYLPGLVVGFLLNWTMFFVVDKGMAPMDAIKASVSFVTSHLSETIVFYLLGIVAFIVGALVCGVGLLVAAPLVLIAAAFTFRQLHGEPVSPAA